MFMTAIFLIVIGILFLLVEILLLPGFTVPGAVGVLLISAGIAWAAWSDQSMITGLVYAAITAGITVPIVLVGLWILPRTSVGKRFILQTVENKEEGFQAPSRELEKLAGKHGKAITPLRPAGAALIENVRVDVVTQGGFIEADSEIEVVMVEGNRVVVRHRLKAES